MKSTTPIFWLLRKILKAITPRPIVAGVRRVWSRRTAVVEWEYMPMGWEAAQRNPAIKNWNIETIAEVYKQTWPDFVRETNGLQPSGLTSPEEPTTDAAVIEHNIAMTYAYVLARACYGKPKISMLDWGGGLGHYYVKAKTLMPEVALDYHCKDVELLVEQGRQLHPEAHYYTDDSCLQNRYDFVMASTSLHYSQDWQTVLAGLAAATEGYLFVTQLPIVQQAASFVFVQRPYYCYGDTEYISWCLNRTEFLQQAEQAGMKLIREFLVGHRPDIRHAPERCEYRGYLFQPIK